jgi:Zn-dependent M28 family amino/carboxypeptidase
MVVMPLLFIFSLPATTLYERIKSISREEMQGVMEFLSHDLLEGRAPGTRGGYLAEIYLKSIFKFLGIEPAVAKSYMQPFKLKGFTIKDLQIKAGDMDLIYREDIVGAYTGPRTIFHLRGPAVFAGFGIHTELWQWDDYKNMDVKDKIVVVRVNDPGMIKNNIFEGEILTYFGRWRYKIEEAIKRGAKGILLVHTDKSAGYDWKVVQNSWGGEELHLESDLRHSLQFSAWIKEETLRRILKGQNIDLDELYKQSLSRRFKPVTLGFDLDIRGRVTTREVRNSNVVAEIGGKSKKRIVLSAHFDHFGIGQGEGGDNIFNGAIDNCSAVAAMMVAAKILKEFQKDLYYTVTLLACNAEEAGLLGSRYYVLNTDRSSIIANINFESTPVWERSQDVMGIGARFSTLEDILQLLAKKEGLTYSYFSMSNQGFFYRSDQFPFARHNIPSMWISAGENDISGEKKYINFWREKYHTVKDEYDPNWKLDSMKQTIQMALLVIDRLNRTKKKPKWKRKLTFPVER